MEASMSSMAVGGLYPLLDFRKVPGVAVVNPFPTFHFAVALDRPAPAEVRDFKAQSPLWLALAEVGGVMFWVWKAGHMPWCDLPLCVDAEPYDVSTMPLGPRYNMLLTLVDSSTNRIKNLRRVTVSRDFASISVELANRQLARGYTRAELQGRAERIYHRFPTPELLVKSARIMERAGI